MIRFAKWTAAAAALVTCSGAFAASHDRLDVQLSLANPVVQGDVDVKVNVAVTNTSGHTVSVLRWQLPSEHLQGPLFRITKEDGSPVPYVGPLIKRAAPTADDLVRLEAGASLNYTVELTGAYELGNGRFAIEYEGRGKRADDAEVASAAPLYLWTQGRSEKSEAMTPVEAYLAHSMAATISYTGNCTSSQKTTLSSAVTAATNYATASNNYLAGSPHSTPRYVKWFGTYSSSGWSTAHTHFTNEVNAFTTKPLTLDCSCKDSNTYAYVYPNAPYKIYVCGAFWSAPMTGTDSKGGTLVHEMSHFYVVASTDDWAYGQTAAANLAKNNPTKALDNADSHEYFAENNPFLQ
jgi:peptidyl-Lys metalloendopeptidase